MTRGQARLLFRMAQAGGKPPAALEQLLKIKGKFGGKKSVVPRCRQSEYIQYSFLLRLAPQPFYPPPFPFYFRQLLPHPFVSFIPDSL